MPFFEYVFIPSLEGRTSKYKIINDCAFAKLRRSKAGVGLR
jgi:hypothetical protein